MDEGDSKSPKCARSATCDLIVVGRIFTGVGAVPWANGLAVRGGCIEYVGSKDGALACAAWNARVLHAPLCLPGFHDAHCHPFGAGMRLAPNELQLAGLGAKELAVLIEDAHGRLPAGSAIIGAGLSCGLPGGSPAPEQLGLKMTPAEFLDKCAPGRAVVLADAGGHAAWASWSAMERIPFQAGNLVRFVSIDTTATVVSIDVEGSRVTVCDSEFGTERIVDVSEVCPADGPSYPHNHGRPTGCLYNPWAAQLIAALRAATPAVLEAGLRRGLREAVSHGITAIVDAFVPSDRVQTYCKIFSPENKADDLPRVSPCFGIRPHEWVHPSLSLERLERDRSSLQQVVENRGDVAPKLLAGVAKFEVDGPAGDGLAWMLQEYKGAKQLPSGGPVGWTIEALQNAVSTAIRARFGIHAHVMGDAAVRFMLDTIIQTETDMAAEQQAMQTSQSSSYRSTKHTLAHLYHVDKSDVARFREARACAHFAGQWMHAEWAGNAAPSNVVGDERAARFTPVNEFLAAGQDVCLGSDWDVVREPHLGLSPLAGIETAVTHRRAGTGKTGWCTADWVWQPHGRLTVEEAVRLYTAGSANSMALAPYTGTVERGKRADLVLLDKDIFELPSHQISAARVTHTLIDGKVAFQLQAP